MTQKLVYTNRLKTIDDVVVELEHGSTSLRIDRNLYKEFKKEAKRRHVEISKLLDHAMRLELEESKSAKEKEVK